MRYYGSIILQPVMGEVMSYMFDPVGEEPADPEEGGDDFPDRETREQVILHAIHDFTRLF